MSKKVEIEKEIEYNPLTEKELIDPTILDKTISEVFYRGLWVELKHLRNNPKMKEVDPKIWMLISKDFELNLKPWYPIFAVFSIMAINLIFSFFPQFISFICAILSLGYIYFIIPFINHLRESERVKYLNKILENTPYIRLEEEK